jgi:hypothetical protein
VTCSTQKVWLLFVLLIAIGGFPLNLSAQSDCSAIVPAMKLNTEINDTRASLIAIADFLETSRARTYQELTSSNQSLFGQYKDVFKIDFNGKNANSNFSAWKEEVVRTLRVQSISASSFSTRYETMAKDAIEAWSACIASKGLHVWTEVNDGDPKKFSFNVKYLSTDPIRPFISFTPRLILDRNSPTATCDDLVGYGGIGARPYRLGGSEAYQTSCTREDPSQSPSITVATQLGSRTAYVAIRRTCTESSTVVTQACPYPKTDGAIYAEIKMCVGNKVGQNSSRIVTDSCRDVGCRKSSDIVRELAQSFYGSPATDQDIANWAPKLDRRLPIPDLIVEMAADQRFFDKVLPPTLFGSSPYLRQDGTSNDQPTVQRLAAEVLRAVGVSISWETGLDLTARPELRNPVGFGGWKLDQAAINRLVRLMVTQPDYVNRYGRDQIPPSIVGGRVLRLCGETSTTRAVLRP